LGGGSAIANEVASSIVKSASNAAAIGWLSMVESVTVLAHRYNCKPSAPVIDDTVEAVVARCLRGAAKRLSSIGAGIGNDCLRATVPLGLLADLGIM
jgi:hypothetical protein